MKILLLSDNHGYHDDAIMKHAEWADEIWHAGDWLNLDLYDELLRLDKPIRAVWGNADPHEARLLFPENLTFTIQGLRFLMTHIGGYPGKFPARVKALFQQYKPDVFICGHSHILRVMRAAEFNNALCMNPGACGLQGFHQIRTALRFSIEKGQLTNLEVVEFGARKEAV